MFNSWKKKHSFHLFKRKGHVSKEIEIEVKNLENQGENEFIEDQFHLVKYCEEEINSLESIILKMLTTLTSLEKTHRMAERELQEFIEEIKTMANEKPTMESERKRNIESRSVCLKNKLVMQRCYLITAQTINEFELRLGIFKLQNKIKKMKKIMSPSNSKKKT